MEKYNQRNIEYKLLIKDIAFALAAGGVGAILGGKMNEFNLKLPVFRKMWYGTYLGVSPFI